MHNIESINGISAASAIDAVQAVRYHKASVGSAPKSLDALEQAVSGIVSSLAVEFGEAADVYNANRAVGALRANYGFLLSEFAQSDAKLAKMAELLASPKGRVMMALWLLEESAGDDEEALADAIEAYQGAEDVLDGFQLRFREARYVVRDRLADREAAEQAMDEAA